MKKQEIFDKMVEVQSKLKNEFNFDYWLNPRGIDNYVARTSKQDLEYTLKRLEDLYLSHLVECKTNEYYATDEGSKMLENVNERISNYENKISDLKSLAETKLTSIIKEWLGENWKVILSNSYMEVWMTNENGECKFGKYFVLRFHHPYGVDKTFENFKYTMTYTLGEISFVEGNEDSVEYIKALGTFVGDNERLEGIKRYIYEVVQKWDCLLEVLNKLDELKRNPLNL